MINKVKEFALAFDQAVADKPCVTEPPPFEARKLRAKLILEEALETVRALGVLPLQVASEGKVEVDVDDMEFVDDCYEYDFTEVLDGLADLEYVSSAGTSVALGISEEMFAEAFEEVHKSNMSKLWTTQEVEEHEDKLAVCKVIVKDTTDKDYFNDERLPSERKYLVKDKDGKVIKSPSFIKPNLEGVIAKYYANK